MMRRYASLVATKTWSGPSYSATADGRCATRAAAAAMISVSSIIAPGKPALGQVK